MMANWFKTLNHHREERKVGEQMKLVSRETVSVNGVKAAEFLGMRFWKQRQLTRTSIEEYKQDMLGGKWTLGEGQVTIGCRQSGDMFMLGGYHRMTALAEANLVKDVTLPFLVVYYEFASDEEMLNFYAQTNKSKTMGLKNSLLVLDTAEKIGVPGYMLDSATGALSIVMNNFDHKNYNSPASRSLKNPETAHDKIMQLQGPIYSYYRMMDGLSNNDRKMFKRIAVTSVALATIVFQPEKALEFWKTAMDNDGLRKGEPQHTLLNYLLHNQPSGITTFNYCCNVASCWNYHFRDKEMRGVRPSEARTDKGIIIAGTPWRGRGDTGPTTITEGNNIK